MPLHLLKLCVGCDSVADLRDWIDRCRRDAEAAGGRYEQSHTTRMVPRRVDELLDDGSLFWVVKGAVQVRQRLLGVRPFTDADGIGRCDLVLDHEGLVLTEPRPCRPFQGWRYLEGDKAPRDIGPAGTDGGLPEHLRQELARLGLL
jgi:hypothetical protein